METMKDKIIAKQDDLIKDLLNGYWTPTTKTAKRLQKELALLKSQDKEPEANKGTKELIDLQQYITNLLYGAYNEWNKGISSSEFDKWVEEQIDAFNDFVQQSRRDELKLFADKLKQAIYEGMENHKAWSVDQVIDEYLFGR